MVYRRSVFKSDPPSAEIVWASVVDGRVLLFFLGRHQCLERFSKKNIYGELLRTMPVTNSFRPHRFPIFNSY